LKALNTKDKIYFPGLNGIRFIAALFVILRHAEQHREEMNLPNLLDWRFLEAAGGLGVSIFFVLSGFLITYLLLAEKEQIGTIAIRKFYMRRVLRIWPLYYLILVLSFFVLPYIPFFESDVRWYMGEGPMQLGLYIFFMPNVAYVLCDLVTYAAQAWSVGVEEQFYLVWPWLIRKKRKVELMLWTIVVGYLVVKFGLYGLKRFYWSDGLHHLQQFLISFRIHEMAMGGIFATWLYRQDGKLNWLYHPATQVAALAGFVVLIYVPNYLMIQTEIHAACIATIILNAASNPRTFIKLENKPLNYLGKISYGLYMYHNIALMIGLKLLIAAGIENVWLDFLVPVVLTIVLAGLSYTYFESWFLRRKTKYTHVISGDAANEK
jgi:Predicted acyltransferases